MRRPQHQKERDRIRRGEAPPRVFEVPAVSASLDETFTLGAMADLLGVSREWAREWAAESVRARRAGRDTPAHAPDPDRYIAGSPVWLRSVVEEWAARRPGKGAPWSGRPRGSKDSHPRARRRDAGQPRDPRVWGAKARAKRAAAAAAGGGPT